jgi:hypothetical protein
MGVYADKKRTADAASNGGVDIFLEKMLSDLFDYP